MKKRQIKRWSSEEIAWFKENYGKLSIEELVAKLGRNKKTIWLQAHHLRKKFPIPKKPYKFVPSENPPFLISELDWAYIAGIFDGEGALIKRDYGKYGRYYVDITNTDKRLIEWLKLRFNNAGIYKFKPTNGKKIAWRCTIMRNNEVYWFSKKVLPYLIIKRDKIKALLDSYESCL